MAVYLVDFKTFQQMKFAFKTPIMYTPTQTNISNHGNSKINDNNVVTSSGIIKKYEYAPK